MGKYNIMAVQTTATGFCNLCKIGDLEYIDQAYISLYADMNSTRPYIALWIDEDDNGEKWVMFPTTKQNVSLYLNGKRTIRDLYVDGSKKGLKEIRTNNINNKITVAAHIDGLPSIFIPNEDSFFNRAHCLNYNSIMHYLKENTNTLTHDKEKYQMAKYYNTK